MHLEEILEKTTKQEILYVLDFLDSISFFSQGVNQSEESINIFVSFLNADLNTLLNFTGISTEELKILVQPSSRIIIEQSIPDSLYFNLITFGLSKHNQFNEGIPIDPITFEIIDIDNFIFVDSTFYNKSTMELLNYPDNLNGNNDNNDDDNLDDSLIIDHF